VITGRRPQWNRTLYSAFPPFPNRSHLDVPTWPLKDRPFLPHVTSQAFDLLQFKIFYIFFGYSPSRIPGFGCQVSRFIPMKGFHVAFSSSLPTPFLLASLLLYRACGVSHYRCVKYREGYTALSSVARFYLFFPAHFRHVPNFPRYRSVILLPSFCPVFVTFSTCFLFSLFTLLPTLVSFFGFHFPPVALVARCIRVFGL